MIGNRPPLRNEQERGAQSAGDAFATTSEPRADEDSLSFVPKRREAARDDHAIELPQFEPMPDDPDEHATPVGLRTATPFGLRTWIGSRPVKSRTRRQGLTIGLLLLLALQAIPSYLWVRDRFEAWWPRAVTPNAQSIPRASPKVAAQSAAPLAGKPDPVPVPPVGTGSVPTPPRSAASTGRVSVTAPMLMQVFVKGRLVGTTQAGVIVLPVGSHDLEFVSEDTGYRTSERVAVQTGRTARVRLTAPMGLVNINATPWADVWIDNKHVGETPIGNLRVAIGRRDVTFRHPDLGERRIRVIVTLKEPLRVAVDMKRR